MCITTFWKRQANSSSTFADTQEVDNNQTIKYEQESEDDKETDVEEMKQDNHSSKEKTPIVSTSKPVKILEKQNVEQVETYRNYNTK